jgi:hypothetical protein
MKITKRLVWEWTANLALCGLFLVQARAHWRAFQDQGNVSSIYFLAYMTITGVFFLTRRMPTRVSTSPADWIVGIFGTWIFVLYQPVEGP